MNRNDQASPARRPVHIKVDGPMADELTQAADREGNPIAAVARRLIAEALAANGARASLRRSSDDVTV